jgi:outer membrane protein with glycine zipper
MSNSDKKEILSSDAKGAAKSTLGGAVAGAVVGTAVGTPVVGTLIGAASGAVMGARKRRSKKQPINLAQRHHRLKSEQRTKLRPTSPNQRQREQGRQGLRRVQSEEPLNLRHKRVGLRLDESAQNRGHRGSGDEGCSFKGNALLPPGGSQAKSLDGNRDRAWTRFPVRHRCCRSALTARLGVGFLPILGFWMIPLWLLFLAQDVPFLQRPILQGLTWLELRWVEWKRRP